MDVRELQLALKAHGCAPGLVDGQYGSQTRAAVMEALTDGPDTRLAERDLVACAQRLGCGLPAVKSVAQVEASGDGFIAGRPTILFEPHRFSRATRGRFDASHPSVSYPHWDRTRYPKTQDGRYNQLLEAVGLDVDAGFASASYGLFQILGENFAACGYSSPFAFALAMAFDEAAQLRAFESFVSARGLVRHLRLVDFDAFALGYNGSAAAVNSYGPRLRAAYALAR